MPDPRDPTPVTVDQREGYYVVIDKDGEPLPGQSAHQDEAAAVEMAKRVNATWSSAKAERKAKGGPAITEARDERVARRTDTFERILGA